METQKTKTPPAIDPEKLSAGELIKAIHASGGTRPAWGAPPGLELAKAAAASQGAAEGR